VSGGPAASDLRPAGAFDVALLGELNRRCFAAADGFAGTPWSPRAFAELLALPGTFGLLILAEGEQPAGFVLVQVAFEDAEVLTLGVLPEFRRGGRGRRLLEAAVAGAAARGAERLHLEVAENNPAAQALYLRAGFRVAGRRRNYYLNDQGRRLDAVVLSRPLAAPDDLPARPES
jgi:[ribosomal protein S18]-alanine N-acetyltransferase